MIEIDALHFRYLDGDFVLDIPELRIERGAAVALIGPSGCGKTTLLHLIAGIAVPASGRVGVGGVDLGALGDANRRAFRITRLGLVFQEFELLEYLSVRDNILLPYRITPWLRLDAAVRARAADLARTLEIDDKLDRLAPRLSQGERQRVAICRALVTRPRLLLADEPTGNLDPDNRRRVLEALLAYARDDGATLVVVTHDHDRLDPFDRVIDLQRVGAAASSAS